MYCTNCGKEVADGIKFCTNCGTPIKPVSSQASENHISDNDLRGDRGSAKSSHDHQLDHLPEKTSLSTADTDEVRSIDRQQIEAESSEHGATAKSVAKEAAKPSLQSVLLHKAQALFKSASNKRILIGICAVVVAAVVVGIAIWQFSENAKAHEPFSFNVNAVIADGDIAETSGVPIKIEGTDLDNQHVDKRVLITATDNSIDLLRGQYSILIVGDPVSDSGTLYESRVSEISIEISEDQVKVNGGAYNETIARDSEVPAELTVAFVAVPAKEMTDELLQATGDWMREFGIDDQRINEYLDAAVEFKRTELERIAKEEALAKAKALQQAAFGTFPATFSYSNGSDSWKSEMKINPDGSFEEEFLEKNIGESGSGYTGTLYRGKFIGSFTATEQVDPTTFKLQLNELRSVHNADESIGSDGVRTVYTATDSRGLGKATSSPVEGFTLYLPGTALASLPSKTQSLLKDSSATISYMVIVSPDGATWVA